MNEFSALILFVAAACPAWAGGCRIEPVSRSVNSVRVTIDPEVELMSVAQWIGGYRDQYPFLLTRESFAYRNDVELAFGQYRNHPAMALVADLAKRGFNFSRPPLMMLHLDDDFALRRDIVPDAFSVKMSGGEEQVRELGRQMDGLCQDIGFAAFYKQQRAYYAALIDQVSRGLEAGNYVGQIESFYGVRQKRYTLVLVSLYGHVGFGPSIETQQGGREVYNILGPRSLAAGVPDFGSGNGYFEYMQRHEFSHPFVNPLAVRYASEVARLAPLFERMPELARKNMCGDWEECLNEQVVRAVTTHFAYRDSQAAGDKALEQERARGAVLVDELLAGVREYAASRDRYPTFESYYPVLLRRLEVLLQPRDRP